ncbi:MAG: 3'-5' exonuclease [Candidatus Rokuibacteriota bacterium]|nr:MAG: 3'-5' exonuclease [Candidatus Rokubacteria bacterium]
MSDGRLHSYPRERAEPSRAPQERPPLPGRARGADGPVAGARDGGRDGSPGDLPERALRDHPRRGARAPPPAIRADGAGDPPAEALTTIPARWIQTPADLRRAAERLAGSAELALDTEGDSLHHYPERLALVQLASASGDVWLLDPLAVDDLSPLARVFAEPGITTVLHAGDNDLTHLKRRYGFRFVSLFDTAVAARFLGAPALGLDVLLDRYLGARLPPSRQKDDWSVRPLTAAQLDYAAADVVHLLPLKSRLVDELKRSGRLAWVDEECATLAAQPVAERVEDPHAFARLKGARELPPRGLAVARELYALRERLARAHDRPPFKILSEETLVRLAGAAPGDREALAQVSGCTPKVIARWGDAILEAVARALVRPADELPRIEPRPRPRIAAAAERRIERLKQWRGPAAPRFGLEPGLLLPNRLITAIALAGPRDLSELARVDSVRRWRVETFGDEIVAALGPA